MRATLIVLLAVLLCFADGPDKERVELVDHLISLDGTEMQLKSLQGQMLDGITPYKRKLTEDEYALLRRSVEENFKSDKLFDNYKKVLAGQMTADSLKAAVKWFETPQARHYTELQTKNTEPGSVKQLLEFKETLGKKPEPASRSKLISDLDRALSATDLFVDLAINMSEGIAVGVLTVQGGATEAQLNTLRDHLVKMRGELRPKIQSNTYINNLFTYRSISDDELRGLIDFYKSPTGHTVAQASFYALNDSLQKASEEVGREVGELRKIKEDEAKKSAKH